MKRIGGDIERLRAECKAAVEKEAATDTKPTVIKREQKRIQTEYDEKIAAQETVLTIAKEACWLYDKFGEGVYQDVPGLCRIATIEEIEGKGCSLTPGAYVGVKPQEDDGVDFGARMKEIHKELSELQKESNELMEKISRNMREMGM